MKDTMRIAILGGGISGLATYLHLRKHFLPDNVTTSVLPDLTITIFESHDLKKHGYSTQAAGAPNVGGGYGLAANGMHSLRRLDPDIRDRILRNSFPTPRFLMKTRQGWTLGAINCIIEGVGGGGKGEGVETCCMVTREVVLAALYEALPAGAVELRKAVEVVDGEEEVRVKFEDGEERTFDLVVGADGIWSRARKAFSGDENGPEYRGLATLGGFVETKYLTPASTTGSMPYPQSQVIMTFGHNGFLGYTPCSTADSVSTTPAHLRGEAVVPRGDMAFWWARSAQPDPKKDPDVEKTKRDLLERMESWKDPNVQSILQNSHKTAVQPTYALPKQQTWAGKRVVLVGDAAHALPTSSGQGVSQSLEDAEALAMLLAHHFSNSASSSKTESDTLQTVFQQYMTVRKAHVERILDAGNRGGDVSRDMSFVAEYTMYAFLWVMLTFFPRLFTKEIETYDVRKEVEKVLK